MRLVLGAALLGAMLAGGCVAVWGDSYNVAAANSSSVTIEFDPAVVNLPKVLAAAQAECDKFGKDAVLDNTSPGNLGIVVNTYRCEVRTVGASS